MFVSVEKAGDNAKREAEYKSFPFSNPRSNMILHLVLNIIHHFPEILSGECTFEKRHLIIILINLQMTAFGITRKKMRRVNKTCTVKNQ